MPVTFDASDDLHAALRRTAETHGHHDVEIGHPDEDWPSWYAGYMQREPAAHPGSGR